MTYLGTESEYDKAAKAAAIKTFEAKVDALLPGAIMSVVVRGAPEPSALHIKDSIEPVYVHVQLYDKEQIKTYDDGHGKLVKWTSTPQVANFKLIEMPGCCGVLVSTNSFVQTEYSGRGIGTFLQSVKEWFAVKMQVGLLIATVVNDNKAEERVLNKTGWVPVSSLLNPKTGRLINVWQKEIIHP